MRPEAILLGIVILVFQYTISDSTGLMICLAIDAGLLCFLMSRNANKT